VRQDLGVMHSLTGTGYLDCRQSGVQHHFR
jgi:hypothetical protein